MIIPHAAILRKGFEGKVGGVGYGYGRSNQPFVLMILIEIPCYTRLLFAVLGVNDILIAIAIIVVINSNLTPDTPC